MKKNKTAIITGAAAGIGKAIFKKLNSKNYHCIVVDVNKKLLDKTIAEINPDAEGYIADISSEKEVHRLFNKIKYKHSSIEVLINNAGIIKDNMIWKMSGDDFDAVIGVNLKGTWLMCREAAQLMRKSEYGRIVNISSRAWLGNPGQSNYSAAKAGVVSLTRVLALELGKYNILVNTVAPGLIDTPLSQSLDVDVRVKLIQSIPTKKIGKVNDVAHAVEFLASENTQFITGQIIYVDGGKHIGAGL